MTLRQDNRLVDGVPMRPVRCLRCATEVLVRKSSWEQTSIQWGAESRSGCVDQAGNGRDYGICPALRRSIGDAVRTGALEIVDGAD